MANDEDDCIELFDLNARDAFRGRFRLTDERVTLSQHAASAVPPPPSVGGTDHSSESVPKGSNVASAVPVKGEPVSNQCMLSVTLDSDTSSLSCKETAIVGVRSAERTRSSLVETLETMPRSITITKAYSLKASSGWTNPVESFDMYQSLSGKILYQIRQWKDEKKRRICMELALADNGDVISSWNTPDGFTSFVCCCAACVPDIMRADYSSPGFSLILRSPDGTSQGHLTLMDNSIHVFGPNREQLYKISCRPTDKQQYKITSVDSSANADIDSFAVLSHHDAWLRLPTPTAAGYHDILLVSGVFALHFMRIHRPSHSNIAEDSCCVCCQCCSRFPNVTCIDSVHAAFWCCRLSFLVFQIFGGHSGGGDHSTHL